jgi:hypothetical protein
VKVCAAAWATRRAGMNKVNKTAAVMIICFFIVFLLNSLVVNLPV